MLIGKAVQIVSPVVDNMNANLTSTVICLDGIQELSLHGFWTGTPVGTLKVQISNDPVPTTGINPGANVVNWTDLSGTSQDAGGAAGDFNWGLNFCRYGWLQLIYTAGSSTGLLTVNARLWSTT